MTRLLLDSSAYIAFKKRHPEREYKGSGVFVRMSRRKEIHGILNLLF
jgi:hypothetical protein